MAQQQMSSSQKALMLELKSLQEEPVEGFRITLVDESDLYNWEVAIFGPPNTLYEGGYFKGEQSLGIERKEAICQIPEPNSKQELRAFLEMAGWCRLWITNFSLLAETLV
ncbi:ubiquitin-conjugating enzyme E2 R2-like [Larus michahellis]|uniref:ubiquitin-conjugating enzyme E2 R2-like n=1 Tax=Larus michahellis TaxID=119627 RepID=UPI003D9BC77E